jgi:NAD(P)-dependent dehydrogenase (short-subunit alcohol dehydrogenase family)
VEQMCKDRVCVVTGAGRGLGREHALMLASRGAKVIVNDLGAAADGVGADASPANVVVEQIIAAGGDAVANFDDVSTWDGAQRLIRHALRTYGTLDVLVNNAGILRDKMLFAMTESDWDSVIAVHLKGTFATMRFASEYWRDRSKAGENNDARIINTSSASGLFANVGQSNYGAAKAAIACLTQIAALELGRYGVTVNAIAPAAITRMTNQLPIPEATARQLDPRWAAPVVAWLASPLSADVTGQVIESSGQVLSVAEGWTRGANAEVRPDQPEDVDVIIRPLLESARPRTRMADITPQVKP